MDIVTSSARATIQFCYWGQAPSKSNYRWSRTLAARKKWARIKQFEEDFGVLAREAWVHAKRNGFQGSMLRKKPPVSVIMWPYNQKIDASNIGKGALDALEGICYLNDKHVGCDIKPMQHDRKGGRIYVQVQWGE